MPGGYERKRICTAGGAGGERLERDSRRAVNLFSSWLRCRCCQRVYVFFFFFLCGCGLFCRSDGRRCIFTVSRDS